MSRRQRFQGHFPPDSRISESTRDRVLSIAREHNYHPNAIARSLNNSRSDLVAIVVNAVANPCEAEQLQKLMQHLQRRGLLPILLSCAGHEDRLQLMRSASAYQVDRVVVFSDMVSLDDAVQIFRTSRPIIVTLEPLNDDRVSQLRVDGSRAVQEVIDKAVADGRRKFAYIYGRDSSWIDKQRKQWFAAALEKHGLTFVADGHGDYTYEAGFKETVLLLRRSKVDAIVCGNDVMAIGARDAAVGVLGRKVPDDLAIVGQDGISMAAWECHDLTTIAINQDDFIDTIIDLIESDLTDERQDASVTLEYNVRWGSTC
ncbi:MAG: substrate-binding domain-containing protein [Pseudomonadota bacterium]